MVVNIINNNQLKEKESRLVEWNLDNIWIYWYRVQGNGNDTKYSCNL